MQVFVLSEKDEKLPLFVELCLVYGSVCSVMSSGSKLKRPVQNLGGVSICL